jgi:FMN phosphatase YigB (HAD superfamily)
MSKSNYSIFLDDGGVINDNKLRGPQWWKLIAEFFIPRYGKTYEEWKEANLFFLDKEIKYWDDILDKNELIDMPKFIEEYNVRWATIMFEYLEIPIPSREDCIKISIEASDWIMPKVKSAFEGMNEVVRYLGKHFDLFTSSGASYRTLTTFFKAQGIETSFKKILGSDTIGVFKSHPSYFDRLFSISGVNPKNSIVIDDKEKVLNLTQKFEAKCIVSNLSGESEVSGKYPSFKSPRELLEIISDITDEKLSLDSI